MEGYWPILFMLVALKIPAIGMIWLLYWASTSDQEGGTVEEGEDGGRRRRPRPLGPRGPRRDPHGGGALKPIPRRSRNPQPAMARRDRSGGRQLEPSRARESFRSLSSARK